MLVIDGQLERRGSVVAFRIDSGAVINQRPGHLKLAATGGRHQRGEAVGVARIDVRAVIEQQVRTARYVRAEALVLLSILPRF